MTPGSFPRTCGYQASDDNTIQGPSRVRYLSFCFSWRFAFRGTSLGHNSSQTRWSNPSISTQVLVWEERFLCVHLFWCWYMAEVRNSVRVAMSLTSKRMHVTVQFVRMIQPHLDTAAGRRNARRSGALGPFRITMAVFMMSGKLNSEFCWINNDCVQHSPLMICLAMKHTLYRIKNLYWMKHPDGMPLVSILSIFCRIWGSIVLSMESWASVGCVKYEIVFAARLFLCRAHTIRTCCKVYLVVPRCFGILKVFWFSDPVDSIFIKAWLHEPGASLKTFLSGTFGGCYTCRNFRACTPCENMVGTRCKT